MTQTNTTKEMSWEKRISYSHLGLIPVLTVDGVQLDKKRLIDLISSQLREAVEGDRALQHTRSFDAGYKAGTDRLSASYKKGIEDTLKTMLKECDRTENEGGRVLLEWYRRENEV
jgi:hypothetical protein